MGFLDFLRAPSAGYYLSDDVNEIQETYSVFQERDDLYEENRYLVSEVRDMQEDMLRISDAFDNAGWAEALLPGDEAHEIPLKTVKKVAVISRAMNTMNPFIKRGVNARLGYIWGKGVTFDGVDDIDDELRKNHKKLFSPQAYEELERVLATDGNAFTALPTNKDDPDYEYTTAFRIVLEEIVGAVSNPYDKEEVWYYKRDQTVQITNSQTGEVTAKHIIKYYPSLPYYTKLEAQGKNLPKRFNGVGIEQNFVIQHTAVNRQVGWRWGVPDIMPVIFWAKAYKEYLEDNAVLVKAYARLAWQVKVPSAAGGAAAASQVMTPPSRDPMTGEMRNVGGTGITGAGGELTPVAATGSSVDFTKGYPLASAVAAGLEIPLVVLTSDGGGSDKGTAETLDLTTLKAMESRQEIHRERLLELFEFFGAEIHAPKKDEAGKKKTKDIQEATNPKVAASNVNKTLSTVGSKKPAGGASAVAGTDSQQSVEAGVDHAIVTFPQIETDTTKDRVTALMTAAEGGILFKQEARKEAIDLFGIAPYKPWDVLPTIEDDPAAKQAQETEAANAEVAFDREQQAASVVAKQGVSGGGAAKGGGQSTNNSSRNNRRSDRKNS